MHLVICIECMHAGGIWEVSKRRWVPLFVNALSILLLLQFITAIVGLAKVKSIANATPLDADLSGHAHYYRLYRAAVVTALAMGLSVLMAALLFFMLLPSTPSQQRLRRWLELLLCCVLPREQCAAPVPLQCMCMRCVALSDIGTAKSCVCCMMYRAPFAPAVVVMLMLMVLHLKLHAGTAALRSCVLAGGAGGTARRTTH